MPDHPDRVLPLQGATNFRDLGGYHGHGGRTVRWRRLFRSDHLGGLTALDKSVLAELGLARALDFRGQAERAAAPYELPGVTQHSLVIEPTVVQGLNSLLAAGEPLSVPIVSGLMTDLYRSLVNDQAHRFAELFEHLLQAEAPVVFHCTAGKDRTGFAAALVLLALGVPRGVVMQDYLLTNAVYEKPPPGRHGIPAEVMAVLWRVQQGFLDAALHAVEADHGGVGRYLHRRLGLSDAALEALTSKYLVEPLAHGPGAAPGAASASGGDALSSHAR
ncbi:MAG: tyrosine-protein phosphatase [Rubrivivax sp.]|nr:tyrosine-protein phosphatase [Rubrivivax sp.]